MVIAYNQASLIQLEQQSKAFFESYSLEDTVVRQIGSSIKPRLGVDQWTPFQKKQAILIAVIAVSAFATLATAFAAIVASSALYALPFCLIVLGVGIYQLSKMKIDLDNPKVREEQQNLMAGMDCDQIYKRFKLSEVIGYDLFQKLDLNEKRAIFYTWFSQIHRVMESIDLWNKSTSRQLKKDYETEVAPLKARVSRAAGRALGQVANNELVRGVVNANVSPHGVAGAVRGVANAAITINNMDQLNRVADVAAEVEVDLRPFKQALAAKLTKVTEEHSGYVERVNSVFARLKADLRKPLDTEESPGSQPEVTVSSTGGQAEGQVEGARAPGINPAYTGK